MSFLRTTEASIRSRLRKYPPLYALVGGVGIVLFWRGVWYCADYLYAFFVPAAAASNGVSLGWPNVIDGALSFIVGSALLLSTGLFVSELAGSERVLQEEQKEEHTVKVEAQTVAQEARVVKKESTELPGLEAEIKRLEEEVKEIHRDVHK